MSGLYPKLYNPGPIEPIVESAGMNVLLQKSGGLDLYQVLWIESIPPSAPVTVNLATSGLAANTSTGATQVSLGNQENMNFGELGQFRFHVLDPVTVTLWQPQGSARNLVQLTQAAYTMRTRFKDPHDSFSEHFVYQQNPAFMVATNYLQITVSQARVQLYGFRYVLQGQGPNTAVNRGANQVSLAHFITINDALAYAAQNNIKFTVVPIAAWGGQ